MTDSASRALRFGGPAYFLAALLILTPPVDWLGNVWPPHPGSIAWRYASEGLFSGTMVTIALGLLLAGAVAALRGDRWVLRSLAVVSMLVAAVLAVVAADFALDVVQLGGSAAPENLRVFRAGGVRVVLKYLATAALCAWVALAAWRSGRAGAGPGQESTPLVSVSRHRRGGAGQ